MTGLYTLTPEQLATNPANKPFMAKDRSQHLNRITEYAKSIIAPEDPVKVVTTTARPVAIADVSWATAYPAPITTTTTTKNS